MLRRRACGWAKNSRRPWSRSKRWVPNVRALQKAADEERQREEEQRQRKDKDNKKERQTEKREDSERMKALLAELNDLNEEQEEPRKRWRQNGGRSGKGGKEGRRGEEGDAQRPARESEEGGGRGGESPGEVGREQEKHSQAARAYTVSVGFSLSLNLSFFLSVPLCSLLNPHSSASPSLLALVPYFLSRASLQDLEEELELDRRRLSEAEGVAKRAEEELGVAKERLLLQEDELQSRAEELLNRGGCEVCVCTEMEELRSQVSRMQSRNRELELQSSGRNNDHARQIRQHAEALSSLRSEMVRAQTEELRRIQKHADDERDKLQKELDKNIEQVEAERANVQQKLEEEKKRLVEKAEEDRKRLKEQVRKAIEEVMRRHAAELHSVQEALSSERKTNQEVCARLDEQRRNAEELRNELERDREELRTKLKDASNETCRLQSAIEHQDKKENGAPEAAASCGPQCSRQEEELLQTRSRLARTQEEGERQRDRQQREMASLRADKHRLEEKVLEQSRLNTGGVFSTRPAASEDRIRAECEDRLRRANRGGQNKEQELQSQMSEQQNQLSELKSKAEQEKEDLLQEPQTQTSGEERHSHAKALQALERQAKEDLLSERNRLQTMHHLELDKQRAELTQQHTEWSRQMTQRHMQQIEDLQAQLQAHTQMMALQQLDESRCAMLELQRENTALKKQLKERSVQENPEAEKKKEEEGVDLRINRDAQLEEEAQRLKEEVEKLRWPWRTNCASGRNVCRREGASDRRRAARRLQERLTERDQLIKRLVEERHQLQLHPPVAGDNSTLRLRDSKSRPGSVTPTMRRKRVESPPRVTSIPSAASYDRSIFPHAHQQAQSIRGPYLEQRGTDGLKQEWFTKYFSF
ncbi:hypothetical protein KUCAC02_015001 [Chaenocephalus aceratus]|uniref:Uncharacterized protein n=1 Tax=Chaenocephalus aceratus TaxID=36190 RepID=A0ACB9XXD7_CHAAC|nr:hypothetical protein KUCAC02_015001 [Chaenocephalus aceratus]